MSDPKAGVRQILDRVKADKRSSLTAPEGKLVCEAYGIPVPREAVAKSAGDAESGLQARSPHGEEALSRQRPCSVRCAVSNRGVTRKASEV
jgi:hypothetical protein